MSHTKVSDRERIKERKDKAIHSVLLMLSTLSFITLSNLSDDTLLKELYKALALVSLLLTLKFSGIKKS